MGFFTSDPVDPKQAPNMFPFSTEAWGAFLGGIYQPEYGPDGKMIGAQLGGAPSFIHDRPGVDAIRQSLSTPTNPLLQGARQNWQPWDAGTQFLAQYLGGGAGASPQIQGYGNNVMQYGGPGGYPTDLMSSMSQFGGGSAPLTQRMANVADYGVTRAGAPGGGGMSMALQYGAPSQAGQYASNMAQFGVSGAAGQPMHQRAMGGPTAAMSYLQPFLNMMPQPQMQPQIQTRQLGRLGQRLSPPIGFGQTPALR